jgi:hypothetical protein
VRRERGNRTGQWIGTGRLGPPFLQRGSSTSEGGRQMKRYCCRDKKYDGNYSRLYLYALRGDRLVLRLVFCELNKIASRGHIQGMWRGRYSRKHAAAIHGLPRVTQSKHPWREMDRRSCRSVKVGCGSRLPPCKHARSCKTDVIYPSIHSSRWFWNYEGG